MAVSNRREPYKGITATADRGQSAKEGRYMFGVLKVITTLGIVLMATFVAYFLSRSKDKASVYGFGFMELVYVLSLICIWG